MHPATHVRSRHIALAILGWFIGAVASAQPSERERIVVAFPKTYGAVETLKFWGGYLDHLSKCAKVTFVNLQGKQIDKNLAIDLLTEKELVAGMKSQQIHLAQLNPGLVPQVVPYGKPFAVPGRSETKEKSSYHLILLVRSESNFKKPEDLIGKRIAHTTPSSNSGNLAPRALFPAIGLVPDKTYEVKFSKGHERSIMGTLYGFWDGAAVASDLYTRMSVKKEINEKDFRILWQSKPFITESWSMSERLSPEKKALISQCTYDYEFPSATKAVLGGRDRFLPVNYETDFAAVREVYEKNLANPAK